MIKFPFERDRWYRLSDLRVFCDEVAQSRRSDPKLSSDIRLNRLPWSKLFNEELHPFRHFADIREFPDTAEFKLSALYHPAVDLHFRWHQEVTIQVTIADVAWGSARDAGKAVRWLYEYLEHSLFAFGGGGTRKVNGALISEPRVLTSEDRIEACVKALQVALVRKLHSAGRADWLLVYARGFATQLIDGGIDQLKQELSRISEMNIEPYSQIFVFEGVEGLHPTLIIHPT